MKMNKKKQMVIAAIGGAVAMLIVLNISRVIEKKVNAPTAEEIKKDLIQGLKKGADELNKSTPLMVDDETRLDSVTVGPGLSANYFYTFPKYNSNEIDLEFVVEELKKEVLSSICENLDMKPTLDHGGIFNYSYSGSDSKKIFNIKINKSDCNH